MSFTDKQLKILLIPINISYILHRKRLPCYPEYVNNKNIETNISTRDIFEWVAFDFTQVNLSEDNL